MATATLKQQFNELQRGRPGRRFQARYEKAKKSRRGHLTAGRLARLILGFAAMAGGLILMVIPGPGLPFLFIGAGLVATESLWVARGMDWLEVRLRAVWDWIEERWKRLPLWGKVVVATLIAAAGAGAAFLFYRLVFG
jgi:hypothetical protein